VASRTTRVRLYRVTALLIFWMPKVSARRSMNKSPTTITPASGSLLRKLSFQSGRDMTPFRIKT